VVAGPRELPAFLLAGHRMDPLPGLAESVGYVRGILAAWAGPDGRPERAHREK